MNAIAHQAPVSDLLRPFLKLAALAFGVGFLATMAIAGAGILAELGQLPGRDTRVSASQPVASPAAETGPASAQWNFPKAI
jgi:hypothetical protein